VHVLIFAVNQLLLLDSLAPKLIGLNFFGAKVAGLYQCSALFFFEII